MENRFWAIAILLVGATNASIHVYKNEGFTTLANSQFFFGGSECLSASSFIRFDGVTFVRKMESPRKQNEMLVEAIIVEVKDRQRIGETSGAFCCTPEHADSGNCILGEVIIRRDPNDPEWPRKFKTFFRGNETQVIMAPETVVINKTGKYYLHFMICDLELDNIVIRGRTIWNNPSGYLPGNMAPLLMFYCFMSLAYLLLGLVWFMWFIRFGKNTVQLHYHITLVVSLGICEMVLRCFKYVNFDSTGMRPMGITLWAVTFSSIKKTISRLLLLVVSMGHLVVKPTLGGITSRVLLLGVTYFVATEALELVEHMGNIDDFDEFWGGTVICLVFLVAILDACFIGWIFSSLTRTIEKLQVKRNMAKLLLYRNFTKALAISVLLSIVWIGFELYFKAIDPLSELWGMAWIIPAVWNVVSYGLLAVICILWTPSNNLPG